MVAGSVAADAGPMTTTTTLHPSGRRTGATWVAATGAFLLLAGAAVFVAVRWDQLPESAKLALVAALTVAFLAGGRALRRTLPATGDVLFHLGAFLLPVDLAGIGVRSGLGWRPLLLAEGILGVVVLGGLGLATGSVVLTWAGTASVAVLAAGVASVSPVAAPLVLVTAAVAAEMSGHRRLQALAWPWAAAAGLAPVLGAAVTLFLGVGDGTMADLGLAGEAAAVSVVSGALAAGVLARQARRHEDLRLAFLALASLGVGLVSGWAGAALPVSAGAVGVAALFVIVELAALLSTRDPFWSKPLSGLAGLAEVPAAAAAVGAGVLALAAPFADSVSARPVWGVALALTAMGFLAADIRRYRGTPRPFGLTLLRGGSWGFATVPLALAAVGAVAVGTASASSTAVALLVVAALATFSGRPWGEAVVAGFAPWAVVTVAGRPALAAVAGLVGSALVAEAAVRRARQWGPSPVEPVLAGVAIATALLGLAVAGRILDLTGTVAAAVPACWLLAVQLERGGRRVADVARLALLVPVIGALYLSPAQGVPVLLAAAVLYAADAVRLSRPEVGIGTALAVQVLVVQVAQGAGITGSAVGLALCVAAVVWAGLAVVVDGEWRLPFLVAAGAGLAFGLSVASADPATFANALLIAGGLAIGAGVAGRRADIAHGGGLLCTAALWVHLATAGVVPSEPYLAPVAAQLLIAGWMSRRRRPAPSSWAAYVPAIAVLGGAALLERLTGGPGWHAVVAGMVGTAAVAVGGGRRLVGPMVAGTALLVAVTVHESLGALAGVPTWGWLTLGGSVLLGVGVALERNDTSPVEAGRRIVDVVAERFG